MEEEIIKDTVVIDITHKKETAHFELSRDETLADLSEEIEAHFSIPSANQKLLVPRPIGLLKGPFVLADDDASNSDRPSSNAKNNWPTLSRLEGLKITLMGTTSAALESLDAASAVGRLRQKAMYDRRRSRKAAAVAASRTGGRRSYVGGGSASFPTTSTEYTFHALRPLPGLPNPSRSLAFLERLRDDRGIRMAMSRHRFSVALLTEMNPSQHTSSTHEGVSRTLGLNRNKGEVIELRLRTDAFDGWRDYRSVRKTLCHELAHNVFGPHDRDFWELCHRLEREVARDADGGRALDPSAEFYEPSHGMGDDEDGEVDDHGGWTGGEYVLGSSTSSSSHGGTSSPSLGLSRREILAKAAEERQRRMNLEGPDGGNQSGSGSGGAGGGSNSSGGASGSSGA